MSNRAQKRAIENYRSRLAERGIVRFELQALRSDRDLIRTLARKLADEGPEAGKIRRTVRQAIAAEPPRKGGIVTALLASPLIGSELDLTRAREEGRKVDM